TIRSYSLYHVLNVLTSSILASYYTCEDRKGILANQERNINDWLISSIAWTRLKKLKTNISHRPDRILRRKIPISEILPRDMLHPCGSLLRIGSLSGDAATP